MNHILFISDLHLSDRAPETLDAFQYFLTTQASKADTLFILGDLFEAWIGDDNTSPITQEVEKQIRTLQSQGIKIYYMHGNRDFLLGKKFATECGMELLPDPFVLCVDNQTIVLTHGDLLCTDDKHYQTFRKIVHLSWIQKLFLLSPLIFRQQIAGLLRQQSKIATPKKSTMMMDVNADAANAMMHKHQAHILIHGHTHKPACHDMHEGKRYVLGAWDERRAVLHYHDGKFELLF